MKLVFTRTPPTMIRAIFMRLLTNSHPKVFEVGMAGDDSICRAGPVGPFGFEVLADHTVGFPVPVELLVSLYEILLGSQEMIPSLLFEALGLDNLLQLLRVLGEYPRGEGFHLIYN